MISYPERNRVEERVLMELNRSIGKRGTWDDISYLRMILIVISELREVVSALIRRDYYGPHGLYAELAQVSACCQKAMLQLLLRQD